MRELERRVVQHSGSRSISEGREEDVVPIRPPNPQLRSFLQDMLRKGLIVPGNALRARSPWAQHAQHDVFLTPNYDDVQEAYTLANLGAQRM